MMDATRTPEDGLRAGAAELAALRRRPCLLMVLTTVGRAAVPILRTALGEIEGQDLDVVLASPGGQIDAAYLAARELRRHIRGLTIFIPLLAKSAATLIALAADEIVFGPLGELGPLDAQASAGSGAAAAADTSRLLPFTAFGQLRDAAGHCYDRLATGMRKGGGMTAVEASAGAAELTGKLLGPVFAQMDPGRVAESARSLEVASEYACRLLRRYRPALHVRCEELLHRLIHRYPAHGFVIDLEEACELGLPARGAEPAEAPILDALARVLIEHDEAADLIAVVRPAVAGGADDDRETPALG